MTNVLIPIIFMYTAGIEGAEKQMATMSNISQCAMFFVAYRFINNNTAEDYVEKGKNKFFMILGFYGIIMSLLLVIFNSLYV